MRDVFVRLVKPAEERYTRRPVPVLELEATAADAAVLSTVVTRFGEERLLTFDRDPVTGAATCEVAHEALLTGWDRLSGWITAARQDIERMDQLLMAAAGWRDTGRNPDYLLTGSRLRRHEQWSADSTMALPPVAVEYLEASVARRTTEDAAEARRVERERRLARRARVRLWGLFAAVAGMVALATFITLYLITGPGPGILVVTEGAGGWSDQMLAGIEQAAEDFNLDFTVATAAVEAIAIKMGEVVDQSPDLILNGFATMGSDEALLLAQSDPNLQWVIPDIPWMTPDLAAEYPTSRSRCSPPTKGPFSWEPPPPSPPRPESWDSWAASTTR